jgi:hypothetical protein
MITCGVALAVIVPPFCIGFDSAQRSSRELRAAKISLAPARLELDHRSQGLGREGLPRVVKCNRHATAVRVDVVPVSTALAVEDEPIPNERADDATSGE